MTCDQWMDGANVPQKRLDLRPTDMQPCKHVPGNVIYSSDTKFFVHFYIMLG